MINPIFKTWKRRGGEKTKEGLKKRQNSVAAEMVHQLKALAASADGPCSVASTHTVVYSSRRSNTLFWPLWAPQINVVYIH